MTTQTSERRGLTVPVGKYAQELKGRLEAYHRQFEIFYEEAHQFTYDELMILQDLLPVLKQAIDEKQVSKGIEITNAEVEKVLRASNLLLREPVLPGNFVIPLYDLIMSKTYPIEIATIPPILDVFYVGESLLKAYIYDILAETDRYQSAILVKTKDGKSITFLPGRIWVESSPTLHSEVVLGMNFNDVKLVLDSFKDRGLIRGMSKNEKTSKTIPNEAELNRGREDAELIEA